jgi:hypothetical protein
MTIILNWILVKESNTSNQEGLLKEVRDNKGSSQRVTKQ